MSEQLPQEHVPSPLRPTETVSMVRTKVVYFTAYEWQKATGSGVSFGVFAGPFDGISEVLETVPPRGTLEAIAKESRAVIVRYNLDGTDDVVYRWQVGPNKQKWIKAKGAE